MIQKEIKRLAEVGLMIAVSRHGVREKAIHIQAAALSPARAGR